MADRSRGGENFLLAVGELLDEFALGRSDSQRRRALEPEPAATGLPRFDANLVAMAEHLAVHRGLA